MDIKHIIIIELIILALMIVIKAIILRLKGIKTIRTGRPDKNVLTLLIVIVCFVYASLSGVLNLPFPAFFNKPFWDSMIIDVIAILLCAVSLIWFGFTLIVFGNSFRIGIDETTTNQLITDGTFALSRNPVFITFIAFSIGFWLAFSTMVNLVFLVLLILMVHRQILKEETFLKKRYGKEYEDYCKKVRRYI